MSPTQSFIIFCLEAYKTQKKITGKEALSQFEKNKVFDYLTEFYDILHTQGMNYIVIEIIEFIKNQK